MFNWEAIGTALHANPKPRQHFITKLTTGFLGVGKWMKHWGKWEEDLCPRCGVLEDAVHVVICKGNGANEIWDSSLKTWLEEAQTDPDIITNILLGLRNGREGTDLPLSNCQSISVAT